MLNQETKTNVLNFFSSSNHTGNLVFIEFQNNENSYLGLIDSGAQLNVISSALLPSCCWKPFKEKTKLSITGVNGVKSRIIEWITMNILLKNGLEIKLTFAVIDLPKSTIIFGIPFLKEVKAKLDFNINVLDTFGGPVDLLQIPKTLPCDVNLTLLPQIKGLHMENLLPLQKNAVLELLTKFSILWKANKQGRCAAIEHVIQLTTQRLISSKPRRYCEEHSKAIQKNINLMLKDNIIRPSMSPYCSEIVMVKKKNGEYRMCIDYRQLNKYTLPDKYPLPKISELLRSVKGAKYFVALDLRSGYWQIPMAEESIKYTAFRTPQGLFEFTVMPFGLTNAPSTFQRAMDFLLADLKYYGTSVYLDDILIYGETFEKCFAKLEVILGRLKEAGLTINLEKCNFFPKEISYLGHILSNGKLLPNVGRVKDLEFIKPAKNVTELRSILGMFGFYQMFISNYAELVLPLTNALRGVQGKNVNISWTNDMQIAVEKLAAELKTAVLEIPVDGDEYKLETDASDKTVAGILSVKRNNKWLPIEFTSKKLSGAQLRWPIREKEAFAIIHCLQKFDPFLRSRPFTVYTDHQSLQWMFNATTGKIARWASRLSEYEMQVIWKKGKDIVHVDFFSRQIEAETFLENRMVYCAKIENNSLPTIEDVLFEQQTDSRPDTRGYITRGKVTYYRNGIWVPPKLRTKIIAACHLLPPFCHSGCKKTKSTILRVFNWPGIHEDVQNYIKGCLSCQRLRPGLERIQGLLKTHPIPGPFDVIYIDIYHCSFAGQQYSVLTMIDISTRWVEAEVIQRHTADAVSDAFLRCWVCRFGVPKILVTDNEKAFASDVLKKLVSTLGTTQLRTTPYHPQGNAPIESFHRMLNKRILLFDRELSGVTPFPTVLQLILWSYRIVVHSTTRETPAFLVYGLDLRPPFVQDWRFDSTGQEKDRINFLNIMREDIQYQAYQRRLRENEKNNIKRCLPELKQHQLVLLRSTDKERQFAATSQNQVTKLVPRWSLPYRIIRVYPGGQRVLVRNLLTRHTRDAHISDIRLIEKPMDDVQQLVWEKELQEVTSTMFDSIERDKVLREFWEEVKYPQRSST